MAGAMPSTGLLRFAIAQAPLNLDPRYASDAASERINRLVYQSLVRLDEASQPQPALAHWAMIDPLHIQFTLNMPTPIFHDGAVLDAGDVVATYQSLLSANDSPHHEEYDNIAAIRALDSHNVEITLHHPDPLMISRMTLGILPKQKIAQDYPFHHHPIGSGPLKFVRWQKSLTLQRMSDGLTIRFEEVKDPTVRVLKLLRGEADMLQGDLPPELVKYLIAKPDLQVMESEGSNFSYIGMNLQDPSLKQLAVRQAIAHGIDRQAIVKQVMVGHSRMAESILPPEHWVNHSESHSANITALQPYDYNPELSKRLLKQAGIKLPLTFVYKTSTDPQRVRFATILQSQLKAAGIHLDIRSLDWGTYFADIQQGHFQLYGLTWVGVQSPDIYRQAFASASIPPKGANRGHLDDRELDRLIEKQDWPAVTQRVHDLLPYIPLWYEGQFVAMPQSIKGYNLHHDGNWDGLVSIALPQSKQISLQNKN